MPAPVSADALLAAFDADTFRRQGHAIIDQLADYLGRATAGSGMPVLPWAPPDELAARWSAPPPEVGAGDLAGLVGRVLAEANHLHHPRYLGHQVSTPLPAAVLLETASALLNNAMAIYEMGPGATAMERASVKWLGAQLGWGAGSDGVLTSGGSLGNLTALLAARQAKAGRDVWVEGSAGGPPLAVLAATEAHYSIGRAVQIMGLGRDAVVSVAVDDRFRLRADALDEAFAAAARAGRTPIAVVASAGSTATGAYDPLEPIADFCERRGLWLHVDGAHGAAAALSPRYRPLLRGIERADSVVWDAHKMMLQPALITAVLFREGSRSYQAFAQEASYLFGSVEPPWFDIGQRTLECSKRMMGLELWGALHLLGTRLFGEHVTATYDLARRFAARLQAAEDFALAVEPESNIICFRHTPPGARDLDGLQAAIRRRLIEGGAFYLVQTRLPTGLHLRVALMNPFTTDRDLEALVIAIRASAAAE